MGLNSLEKKFIIRLVFVVFLLYSFYLLGTPSIYLPFMGIFFVSMIILRGKIYKKIENYLDEKLPFMQEWSPRKKRILVIFIFIIVSVIVKQILFFGLLLIGIDLQQILVDTFFPGIFPK